MAKPGKRSRRSLGRSAAICRPIRWLFEVGRHAWLLGELGLSVLEMASFEHIYLSFLGNLGHQTASNSASRTMSLETLELWLHTFSPNPGCRLLLVVTSRLQRVSDGRPRWWHLQSYLLQPRGERCEDSNGRTKDLKKGKTN